MHSFVAKFRLEPFCEGKKEKHSRVRQAMQTKKHKPVFLNVFGVVSFSVELRPDSIRELHGQL